MDKTMNNAMKKAQALVFTLATTDDIDILVDIEDRCFDIDRMSQRSIRHMVTKANSDFILGRLGDDIVGYALVLYHRGTHLARLYSFAVLPEYRGVGAGEKLLVEAETRAADRDCIYMRLEVHPNNSGAIRLYERHGYRPFGMYEDYYEDHADALRFEKRILFCEDQRDLLQVPYYHQTTDFTCGAACLIMAMQALDRGMKVSRELEIQLWREATTIYMTSGHGGSSPLGLALAAWRRGFRVEVYINTQDPLFLDGVRNEDKKAVMKLVHQDFVAQIAETDISLNYSKISLAELENKMENGGIPLAMISTYSYTRYKAPHWVVMSGIDETFVYIHDPEEDAASYRNQTDNVYLPVARQTFDNSFRFGKSGLRTSLIIYSR